MAYQNDEDADVKKIAAPHELPAAQELTGPASPGILFPVEPDQAADQEYRQANIGIDSEKKKIDPLVHVPTSKSGLDAD